MRSDRPDRPAIDRPTRGATPDHRTALGLARRERTRKQLLLAAARLVAARGAENLSVDDFIKEAGVARGTFYNYFETRDHLIATLWEHAGTTSLAEFGQAGGDDKDPAVRLVAGLRASIRKAAGDHVWGWLLYRMTTTDSAMNESLRSFPMIDLQDGIEQGRFSTSDLETATDFLVGVSMMAFRAVLTSSRPDNYPESIAAMVLQGLGLSAEDAADVAQRPLRLAGS